MSVYELASPPPPARHERLGLEISGPGRPRPAWGAGASSQSLRAAQAA